jgi:hypothetical protein
MQADPETYLAPPDGEDPVEWTEQCAYTDGVSGSSPLWGATVVSEPTGSYLINGITVPYLSAADSWSDLIDDLQESSDNDCADNLPVWQTNMDEAATSSGNETWPSS